ncbi:MAG TPA: ChuX/HutX family heme-like substrate-binding protein [Candidatus Binatia bacterium]|nr:ChuX/HutX family heme-like substrate-binding protein [Candidatus Binatia bacterium]
MATGPALDWQQPSLRQRWDDLRGRMPTMVPRDAARLLGVSEGEVVAIDCGDTATRLETDWSRLLGRLSELGFVRGITRGPHAVIETRGVYGPLGSDGAVRGEGVELRLFPARWRHAFACRTSTRSGMRRSLAFFDAEGAHVHELVVERRSGVTAFERVVADHASPEQLPWLEVVRARPPVVSADVEIDLYGLRATWDAMRDTSEFQTLLRRFGLRRTQALRLAGASRAERVALWSLRLVLERAASEALPLVMLAGNAGVVQIHRGVVRNARALGPWLNVLDDDVTLNVRADAIAEAWVVRKPTRDGISTSLELFDADGGMIALLSGDGAAWRALVESLRG